MAVIWSVQTYLEAVGAGRVSVALDLTVLAEDASQDPLASLRRVRRWDTVGGHGLGAVTYSRKGQQSRRAGDEKMSCPGLPGRRRGWRGQVLRARRG